MTAAAKTRFLRTVNRHVAEFAGEAVVAIKQLAVDDDAAAYAGAEGYHNEILHSLGGAVHHLADGGGIGVIGQGNRQTAEQRRKFLAELHRGVVGPGDVGGIADFAGVIVAVGGTYAHSLHCAFDISLLDAGEDGV